MLRVDAILHLHLPQDQKARRMIYIYLYINIYIHVYRHECIDLTRRAHFPHNNDDIEKEKLEGNKFGNGNYFTLGFYYINEQIM